MSPKWRTCRDAYKLHLQAKGRTPETVALHLHALDCWQVFCRVRHIDPLKPTVTQVEGWLASLYAQYSHATVAGRFHALRLFLRAEGDATAFDGLHPPHAADTPIRPYSMAELRQLLAAAETSRDRAVVLVLLGSGLRASELVGLRFADVDWDAGLLRVVGKGNKPRSVCPGNAAMRALRLHAGSCRRGYVFPGRNGHLAKCSLWLLIERLAVKAGIDGGVHRFRHSFAHFFLEEGGDIGDLRIILGHSSFHMTARYAAFYQAERALCSQKLHNPADALFSDIRRDIRPAI